MLDRLPLAAEAIWQRRAKNTTPSDHTHNTQTQKRKGRKRCRNKKEEALFKHRIITVPPQASSQACPGIVYQSLSEKRTPKSMHEISRRVLPDLILPSATCIETLTPPAYSQYVDRQWTQGSCQWGKRGGDESFEGLSTLDVTSLRSETWKTWSTLKAGGNCKWKNWGINNLGNLKRSNKTRSQFSGFNL